MKILINKLGITILTPENGKWLSNGETMTDSEVYLGIYDSISNWIEIDPPLEEEEEDNE